MRGIPGSGSGLVRIQTIFEPMAPDFPDGLWFSLKITKDQDLLIFYIFHTWKSGSVGVKNFMNLLKYPVPFYCR